MTWKKHDLVTWRPQEGSAQTIVREPLKGDCSLS